MPQIRVKRHAIWACLIIVILSSVAVAQVPTVKPIPTVNAYGMPAPFLLSWAGIWFFAAAGAIGSTFIKMDDIDKRFNSAYIAKPYLGFFGSIALCVYIAKGAEPPESALMFLAFMAGSGGAVVLQGLLVFLANLKNQAAIIKRTTGVELELPQDKGGQQ